MASVALDNIWDAPVAPSTPRRRSPTEEDDSDGEITRRPSKRPRSSLFLESDEEDSSKGRASSGAAKTPSRPDIDAMFENLDDDDDAFQPLAPSLDLDALRRDAEERHARSAEADLHAILPSSSPGRDQDKNDADGTKKTADKDGIKDKRRPLPRLDETRLLGPNGFPALITEAERFKAHGKGHEVQDLNRLMQVYQFWAHKMYPKMQFRDTVTRVEKLCHSKRMHVALSVWRDQGKGLNPEDAIDLTSDIEAEAEDAPAENVNEPRVNARRGTSTITDVENDSDGAHLPSIPPSGPPSSSSPPPSGGAATDPDDFDIDAMIREEEEMAATSRAATLVSAPSTNKATDRSGGIDEDEEAMWDEMMTNFAPDPLPLSRSSAFPQSKNNRENDDRAMAQRSSLNGTDPTEDEQMWDVIREMEIQAGADHIQSGSTKTVAEKQSEMDASGMPARQFVDGTKETRRVSNGDDWEDMYL